MDVALEIIRDILLVVGALFVLAGNIGVLRFPSFFTRVHAAGVTDTAGAGCILLGLAIEGGFSLVTAKIFMILLFLFFTSPTSSHALAKAALHRMTEQTDSFRW